MFQHLGVFFAASVMLALLPGPGMTYVVSRSLAGGVREGLASSLGTGTGGLLQVVLGAAGLSALVMASAELFTMLKLAGAVYLIWLGIGTILRAKADEATPLAPRRAGMRRAWRDGMAVALFNPKTAAFFIAFLPQFINPGAGRVGLQFLALGAVAVCVYALSDAMMALLAARLKRCLAGQGAMAARIRQLAGGMMICLGVGLLFARRPAA
ncbi:LysE family translocator [Acidocella sp.]|uniref:LysE family translocator n=1 Tax=Acidocella sp. TaxID=50710 RepID=UPI003D02499F